MTLTLPDVINAPYSQEAEEALLGSVVISPKMFYRVENRLTADDFFLLRHNRIWSAIHRLMTRHSTFDFVTLCEELKTMKVFDDIGGYAYIMRLMNDTPTSVHAEIYAELVARTSVRRKMLEASDRMRELAVDEEMDLGGALKEAESAFVDLARHEEASHLVSVADSMSNTDMLLRERMALFQKNPNYVMGICSGINALDKHLDGFREGITTLAASTGMGKTAAALTVALNASCIGKQHEEPQPAYVHVFSGEMTQQQIDFRLLSMKSGVPMERLMRGELTAQEYRGYQFARQELTDLHALTFESGKQLTVMEIRNRVRELVNTQRLDLFIIDGLLQISGLQIDKNDSSKFKRYQEQKRRDAIEYILNELEYIAMTFKMPLLLTHQVNRAPAGRNDKRPNISDMAEASFVEWKSSVILFLYRDAYYNPIIDDGSGIQEAELIIAKNRHGAPGLVKCLYESKKTLFANGYIERGNFND